MNHTFRKSYVGENATREVVQRLHEIAAQKVEQAIQIPAATFLKSAIVQWPLYHCVSRGVKSRTE